MPDFTTPAEWRSNRGKQRELEKVLELPILREAFATIRGVSRPNVIGTLSIESIAIRAAQIAGKHDALDDLVRLTQKPEKPHQESDAHTMMTPEDTYNLTKQQQEP
jgi:hypothetical protein